MYRYIGNKSRLVSTIVETLKELAPSGSTVADVMCGTGSISEALRVLGYRVIASDIMTYSLHHARIRLLLDSAPSFSKLRLGSYFDVQEHLQNLKPRRDIFYREYSPAGTPRSGVVSRKYFTSENAAKIDAINTQISRWNKSGNITEIENSLLRHDLIRAVNRVANIAGTYGHYRSKWSKGSLAALKLEPTDFIKTGGTNHVVLQGAAENLASKISADICYIDPPYMKRQYAANYHIIETIARGDKPKAIGLSGLRPWRDQYSNFCTKTKILQSFEKIFTEMKCSTFVISYSEDGLLSHAQMMEMLSKLGKAECQEIEFNRFRSNKSSLGRTLKEYLFILRRKPKARFSYFSKKTSPLQHVSGAI